jgi:hypothetical protein
MNCLPGLNNQTKAGKAERPDSSSLGKPMSGLRGSLPRSVYWPLETPTGYLEFKGCLDPEYQASLPLGHLCTEEMP